MAGADGGRGGSSGHLFFKSDGLLFICYFFIIGYSLLRRDRSRRLLAPLSPKVGHCFRRQSIPLDSEEKRRRVHLRRRRRRRWERGRSQHAPSVENKATSSQGRWRSSQTSQKVLRDLVERKKRSALNYISHNALLQHRTISLSPS